MEALIANLTITGWMFLLLKHSLLDELATEFLNKAHAHSIARSLTLARRITAHD